MTTFLARALVALCIFLPQWPAAAEVSLPRTEEFRIRSGQGIDYVIEVALPRGYAGSKTGYPVVVTLDADYAFALARNVIEHFSDRGDIPEMIAVSIAYPGGNSVMDNYRRNRTRDYTPTHVPEGGYGPEFQKLSGGGPRFLKFIADDLAPALRRRYRMEKTDWTLVGHSYGGLFGAYVLRTQPRLFQRYLLVSPSLWYDHRALLRPAQIEPAPNDRGALRVFLAVGADENQYMSDDLATFAARLCGTHPAAAVSRVRFPGETHDSVFPGALSRGLRVLFGQAADRSACTPN